MKNINEDLGNVSLIKKLDRWSAIFTMNEKTPANVRFVNADGRSIMDLLKDEGTTIVQFYRERRDIDAFLKGIGFSLDDFKWNSPYGVISIPEALQKINAGEIEVPLNPGHWSLEQLLCFKGVTYNHLFNPISKIRYERLVREEGGSSLSYLLGGITIASMVLGYSLYFGASMFADVALKDRNVEERVELSQMIIDEAAWKTLPYYKAGFSAFGGEPAGLSMASEFVANNIVGYGSGTSGNFWGGVSALSRTTARNMGRETVDQAVLETFLKEGVRVTDETCSRIDASQSFAGVGGDLSPLLYVGAMDEGQAIGALRSMIDTWKPNGEVNAPRNGRRVDSVKGLLSHVGGVNPDGTESKCAVSPVTIYQPKIGTFQEAAPFVLVNLLVRSPVSVGSAEVSSRLFAFAWNKQNPQERIVREIGKANPKEGLDKLLAERVPELFKKSADADSVCEKMDDGESLSVEDQYAYYRRFMETMPSSPVIRQDDLKSWSDGYGLPESIPVVSLAEFMGHRYEGQCQAESVMAYKLDSATTPYLISIAHRKGQGVGRGLLMAYDTGDKKGFSNIPCRTCSRLNLEGVENFEIDKIKMTAVSISDELSGNGLGVPKINSSKFFDVVASEFMNKASADKKSAIEALQRETRLTLIDLHIKDNSLAGYVLNKGDLADQLIDAGLFPNKADQEKFKRSLPIEYAKYANTGNGKFIGLDDAVKITYDAVVQHGLDSAKAESEVQATIRSLIIGQIGKSTGIDQYDILDSWELLANPKSVADKAKLKFKIDEFYNDKESLKDLIAYAYKISGKSDIRMHSLGYTEATRIIERALLKDKYVTDLLNEIESSVRNQKN